MADQLYLSLWFPNFRLETLPQALTGVLRQFATISADPRVAAASAYPIDFTESPTYQRIYVTDDRAAETPTPSPRPSTPPSPKPPNSSTTTWPTSSR